MRNGTARARRRDRSGFETQAHSLVVTWRGRSCHETYRSSRICRAVPACVSRFEEHRDVHPNKLILKIRPKREYQCQREAIVQSVQAPKVSTDPRVLPTLDRPVQSRTNELLPTIHAFRVPTWRDCGWRIDALDAKRWGTIGEVSMYKTKRHAEESVWKRRSAFAGRKDPNLFCRSLPTLLPPFFPQRTKTQSFHIYFSIPNPQVFLTFDQNHSVSLCTSFSFVSNIFTIFLHQGPGHHIFFFASKYPKNPEIPIKASGNSLPFWIVLEPSLRGAVHYLPLWQKSNSTLRIQQKSLRPGEAVCPISQGATTNLYAASYGSNLVGNGQQRRKKTSEDVFGHPAWLFC